MNLNILLWSTCKKVEQLKILAFNYDRLSSGAVKQNLYFLKLYSIQRISEYECNTEELWAFFQNGQVNEKFPVHNTCFYLRKLLIVLNRKKLHQLEQVMKGLLKKYIVIRKALVSIFLGFICLLQDKILGFYSLKFKINSWNCDIK